MYETWENSKAIFGNMEVSGQYLAAAIQQVLSYMETSNQEVLDYVADTNQEVLDYLHDTHGRKRRLKDLQETNTELLIRLYS